MATQSLNIFGTEYSRLYTNGYLLLREDPAAWIQLNPKDRLQLVRRLELHLDDDVEEIGDSIGELTHLTHLSIEWAKSLKCLPNVITRLHNLQLLKIRYCNNLQELPASLGELHSLTHLSLESCVNLRALPASLAELHSLTHLTLSSNNLQELPACLAVLHSLTHLTLSHCDNLQELPANLGELHSLTHLTLDWCKNLQALTASLGELHSLKVLYLIWCNNLQELPLSLGELHSLTHLSLESCVNLRALPTSLGELHSLTHLTLDWCNNLRALPASLGELHSLTHLTLDSCKNFQELPASLGELHSLTHLTLSHCDNLRALPASLGELHSLTHLTLSHCDNLRALPASLGELHSLTHLSLSSCKNFQELPTSLGGLRSLTHLSLEWCINLQEIPASLGELHSLTHFTLSCCDAVKFIPNLKVETLYFESRKDNHFPSFGKLSNLQTSILGVSQIPINSDGMPPPLFLDLRESLIKHFSVLGSIKNLPQLEILSLPNCFRLETLPFDLNDSLIILVDETHVRKTWKELKIEMMSSFSDPFTASGLAQNPFNISPHECLLLNEASMIRNLDSYKSVRLLDLSICEDDAEKLTSIKEMSQLTHLYIEGKENFSDNIDLKYLPNTITRLRHLSLRDCDYESFSNCLDMLTNLESLDLYLLENELPENIDVSVLVSLRCLTLQYGEIKSLFDSMAKLSNLKTLVLNHCGSLDSLPTVMNLVKLNLIGTFIHWLPTGLRQLEILHEPEYELFEFKEYGNTDYLKELVNLETFSITCKYTTYLPSLEGLLNLQELQLKDCFNLRKMPKVGKLSKLCTLNISGTRIMSLPDCITNLHNLKHLILPKCFKKESLPPNFGKEPVVIIDDIHEVYYKHMGFHDSCYETSSEDDYEISSNSEEVVDEYVTRISQDDHNTVQTSLHKLQNLPTPVLGASSEFGKTIINAEVASPHCIFLNESEVTRFPEEHHSHKRKKAIREDSQHVLHSLQNQQTKVNNNHQSDDRKVTTQKIDIPLEKIQSLRSSNFTIQEAADILGVSKSTLKRRLRELKIYWPRSNKKKRPRNQNLAVEDNVPIESNVVNYSSNPTLITRTVQECPTTTHGNMDDNQQDQKQMDILAGFSELLVDSEPPDESSSTFVVKATCHGHTGRFNFCPTKSIDQLKEEVRKKLELEDDDFHMEYMDEDQEWVIMNWMSDLIDATSLVKTKSSIGRDVIRLRVTHKNKSCCSTSMTTHMSQVIHDSFQSDIHQKAGLGSSSTQWKSRGIFIYVGKICSTS
ncbi:unnamed protein product [Amaranthus hypochondriacus]